MVKEALNQIPEYCNTSSQDEADNSLHHFQCPYTEQPYTFIQGDKD